MVLSALPPNRRASEQLMFDTLKPDFPELKVDELRTALTWNHERGFSSYRYDEDGERREWFLTETGMQKASNE